MWLNHANNCAQFARKSLIYIEWRMTGLSPVDIFVDGQVNCHDCASYCHDKICHYPGLEPGFFFLDQCFRCSLVVSSKRRM